MAHDCTLDDIAAALRYLDATDTSVWLRAGMAIKDEFGDAGFAVWDDWSQNDSRYQPKECRTRWKSFKGGAGRARVTIATILHLAFERGFELARPDLTEEQKAAFAAEQAQRRAQVAARHEQEQADMLRWYDAVAAACTRLAPHLKTVGNSPYLGKKRVSAHGALFAPCSFILHFHNFKVDILAGAEPTRQFFAQHDAAARKNMAFLYFKRGSILIPLHNAEGELRNLQIIYNDGKTKRFLTNGQKSGLSYLIPGERNDALLVCEGFATGASLAECTGLPVRVCFDATNLPVVAGQLGGDVPRIICADDDWETERDKGKNPGRYYAHQAAQQCGARVCWPVFAQREPGGCTDFNDLHLAEGAAVVRQQIEAAMTTEPILPGAPQQAGAPFEPTNNTPPDYLNDGPPPEAYGPESPAPSIAERPGLEQLLERYALAMPDAKVWDSRDKKVLKQGAFKTFVGAKVFNEWREHEQRRTVNLEDVQRLAAAAQKAGSGGLAMALRRYVYLYPSSTCWDTQIRAQVALGDLRNAIADCFDQWIKHPERQELPKENLVFDPTQKVDPATHINMFQGLSIVPQANLDACKNIRTMLWLLCNQDQDIYFWMLKWLAYPLQNLGAKMTTAVLMHSDVHGSGKSFFFDGVMREIYGEYCRTFGQAELESQYNDWISQSLFGVFEEVLSRSQRYSHTGTIKQLITGRKVRINQKYMQGWEENNHLNCVFLSNEQEPLPVEPSDRRLLVVWPEQKLLDDIQAGVEAELNNGGASAFYGYLLGYDCTGFNEHTKPPMTEAKRRLIELGRPAWEVFYDEWKNLRIDGLPYCACRVIDLYEVYKLWCRPRNENILSCNRFAGYMASKERRRQDMRYQQGSFSGKATFFLVGEKRETQTQEEWLAGCVTEFTRYLNGQKSAQEAKSA